jgi:hypothetical protein
MQTIRLCIAPLWSIVFNYKKLLAMKLTLGLIIGLSLQLCASTYGQKVNIKRQNASLEEVFNDIHQQPATCFFTATEWWMRRKN